MVFRGGVFMTTYNQIEPLDFLEKRKSDSLTIIDIREPYELQELPYTGCINIPMYVLLNNVTDLLKEEQTYYILCHHGQRSYYVTKLLTDKGFKVINVIGGVDLVNRFDRSKR